MTNRWWTDGGASAIAALKSAFTATGAFQLVDGSSDSAMLATIGSGAYTVVCSPEDDDGTVLMEAYAVPGTSTVTSVVPTLTTTADGIPKTKTD